MRMDIVSPGHHVVVKIGNSVYDGHGVLLLSVPYGIRRCI